jgi:hypothetical protein
MIIVLIVVIVLVLFAVLNFAVKARRGSFLITPLWWRGKSGKDTASHKPKGRWHRGAQPNRGSGVVSSGIILGLPISELNPPLGTGPTAAPGRRRRCHVSMAWGCEGERPAAVRLAPGSLRCQPQG